MRDGGAPVLELAADAQQLARLALAGAEVAVVEHQRGQAGGGEALGVGVQALLAHGAEAVGHDHARWGPGPSGSYSQAAQSSPPDVKCESVRAGGKGA